MTKTSLPDALLKSLSGVPGFERSEFIDIHSSGQQVTSVRLNPSKNTQTLPEILEHAQAIPWSDYGFYLPERPFFTFDPLLHAGAYYVQEASSMFLEQVIRKVVQLEKPLRVLDLCAAPGGKSTHLASLINRDSLLVSNEVIKSRVYVLSENLTKWSVINSIITNNDPEDFSGFTEYFDLMVVDAPCSGSGLFRRDHEAINEWSENAVELCQLRQKRILSGALPSLKEGGVLIYSTCSYSPEEDEDIADWLCTEFDFKTERIPLHHDWSIVETESERTHAFGYRFFPNKVKGEGFYIAAFRKSSGATSSMKNSRKRNLSRVSTNEEKKVTPWISGKEKNLQFYFNKEDIFAFPKVLEQDLIAVQQHFYIRHAGVILGRLMKDDLIPDHELALSEIVSDEIPSITLKKESALQYLRKEEVRTEEGSGWTMVNFQHRNLGWIKRLRNRSNNYYPKDWRILKSATTN